MEEEIEIWRPIKGWGKWYEISNWGNVRSYIIIKDNVNKRIEPLNLIISGNQGDPNCLYPTVGLCRGLSKNQKRRPMHILMAENFIPNPENKKYVNHIDGNKYNYAIDNLEWATSGENQEHAYKTGLRKRPNGERNGRAKLTREEVLDIFNSSSTIDELSAAYGIHRTVPFDIKSGWLWSSVTGKKYEKKYFNPLNDDKVMEIFNSPLNQKELASIYGVAQGTISTIKTGKSYSHLTRKEYIQKRNLLC